MTAGAQPTVRLGCGLEEMSRSASSAVILLAKSETAGHTTADWSARGSFATSVRSSDAFASSIGSAEDPHSYGKV